MIKTFLSKFCFTIFVFIFFNSVSFAEYILYKKNGDQIIAPLEEEYNTAIDVLMTWQFPLCLNKTENLKGLSKEDLKLLCEDETTFIQNQLKKIDSKVLISFIPTVFYEFFVLAEPGLFELLSQRKSLEFENFDVPDSFNEGDIIFEFFKKSYNSCNYDQNFYVSKDVYFKINNTILDFIIKNQFSIKNSFLQILNDSLEKYNNSQIREEGLLYYILSSLDGDDLKVLKNVLDLEFVAYRNGCFNLYRGTSGHEGMLDVLKLESESTACGLCGYGLSFGNSLFAGIIYDHGASAFSYIFDSRETEFIGYSLFIPKLSYIRNFLKNGIKNSLFIAPVNTINGLLSYGELFHSRVLEVYNCDYSQSFNLRENFFNCLKIYAFILVTTKRDSIYDILGVGSFYELIRINLPYRLMASCTVENFARTKKRKFRRMLKTRV